MAGGASTVRANDCIASGATPLLAVIVIPKTPSSVGVPPIVAVPSPLSGKEPPAGRAPVLVSVTVLGSPPAAVTVKAPAVSRRKVAELPLVIVGPWFTVSVNDWVTSGAMPLLAV